MEIDVEGMEEIIRKNDINGRMFDKTDTEHFKDKKTFIKLCKSIPNSKANHIGRLYGFVTKWKYVEVKKVVVESKEDDDGEESEDDDLEEEPNTVQADVYEIGKKFVFWKSQRTKKQYVHAKYKNMKEEILQSPLIRQFFPDLQRWEALCAEVAKLVVTRAALQITSNGEKTYLYGIQRGEPLDSEHLCALKLYTDFDDLCEAFCAILRRGDPMEIAEIAHWTRILTETIQCFGSRVSEESSTKTYYRGVKKTFMFVTIVSRFNLPQSTTSSVEYKITSFMISLLARLTLATIW